MQYEENDPRHPRYQEHPHQRRPERPQRHQEEYFNDFRSRWGDPTPIFSPPGAEWYLNQGNRYPGEGRLHNREEWLPNQRRPEPANRQRQQEQNERPPVWRQRDVHFDRSNQHANDRWQNDNTMPHPNEDRPWRRDEYRDDRQRR
ncbi:hypothetical protein [Pontibacter chitinilyticus]|uniref:hypothetical protein n=1 Tax=Pontibacter chitinilyticus TaxID=2674989 RepID=UPI00321B65BC